MSKKTTARFNALPFVWEKQSCKRNSKYQMFFTKKKIQHGETFLNFLHSNYPIYIKFIIPAGKCMHVAHTMSKLLLNLRNIFELTVESETSFCLCWMQTDTEKKNLSQVELDCIAHALHCATLHGNALHSILPSGHHRAMSDEFLISIERWIYIYILKLHRCRVSIHGKPLLISKNNNVVWKLQKDVEKII